MKGRWALSVPGAVALLALASLGASAAAAPDQPD